jgi:hypothetical protein
MSEVQPPVDSAPEIPADTSPLAAPNPAKRGHKRLASLAAAFLGLIAFGAYLYWSMVHDRNATAQIQTELAKDGIQVVLSRSEPKQASFSPFQSITPTVRVQGATGTLTDSHLHQIRGINQDLSLLLNNCPITDNGLAELEGKGNVRWLELRKTMITDGGLKHLRGMDLEALDLSTTSIGDAGLAALGQLDLPNLNTLVLEGLPKVTDDGITHLSGFKELEWLLVSGTKVTNAGARHLKTKIPRITVMGGS